MPPTAFGANFDTQKMKNQEKFAFFITFVDTDIKSWFELENKMLLSVLMPESTQTLCEKNR